VVLDGLITAAAALAAERILPGSRRALIASHLGKERGMEIVYRELSLNPVIRAALALGEGSGAVMLFPLLDLADAVYDTKRTFAQIELEPYRRFH
jgi:nicotinate-nucleotide--dimethylbenzimidazole phosphoribosyltransferase